MVQKVPCISCGLEILAGTAARNQGMCRRCKPTKKSRNRRRRILIYVGTAVVAAAILLYFLIR